MALLDINYKNKNNFIDKIPKLSSNLGIFLFKNDKNNKIGNIVSYIKFYLILICK